MYGRFDIYELCIDEAAMAHLAHKAHGTALGSFYAHAASNMAARIRVAAQMYADDVDSEYNSKISMWARRNEREDNEPARIGPEM
jgi:hypothetical protein